MSILSAVQEWLAGCPLMRPVIIQTDQVAKDATSYAVMPTGNSRISEDILGHKTYQNSYAFYCRETAAFEVDRQDAHDFLEAVFEWIEAQNEAGLLPALPGRYAAEEVEPSNAMLLDVGEDGTGIYQIQIQLVIIRR